MRDAQIILENKIAKEKRKKKLSQKLSLQNKIEGEKEEGLEPCISSKFVVPKKLFKNQKKIKYLLKEQPIFLLQCKETPHSISQTFESLPKGVQNLLHEFDDLFSKEIPHGLLSLRE